MNESQLISCFDLECIGPSLDSYSQEYFFCILRCETFDHFEGVSLCVSSFIRIVTDSVNNGKRYYSFNLESREY